MLGGDFNVVRFNEERRGGDRNDNERSRFNGTIQQLQLMDLSIADRKYIWSSLHESPSLAKLDRILVSLEWESYFPLARVQLCHCLTSDHVPLKLIIREGDNSNFTKANRKKLLLVA